MKKIQLAIISIASILMLSSCGASNGVIDEVQPTEYVYTVPYKQTANSTGIRRTYSIADLKEGLKHNVRIIPDTAIDMIDLYNSAAKALSVQEIANVSFYSPDSYDINNCQLITNGISFTFANGLIKEVSLYETDRGDNVSMKNMFSCFIKAVDGSVSIAEAQAKAQEIANMYTRKGEFSPLYINGFYTFLCAWGDTEPYTLTLYALNPSNMRLSDAELSQYQNLDYSALSSKMNDGMKVTFHGTIKTFTLDDLLKKYPLTYFVVTGDDGNLYKVYYRWGTFAQRFNIKQTYTFYGTLDNKDEYKDYDKPLIRLDWCE